MIESLNIKAEPLMIFDGNCGLCNHIVRMLVRADKSNKLKFVSNSSENIIKIFPNNYETLLQCDSIIIIEGNCILYKSKAVISILKYLPYPWQLLRVFQIMPSIVLDKMYDYIALRRYKWFGKLKCDISFESAQKSKYSDSGSKLRLQKTTR